MPIVYDRVHVALIAYSALLQQALFLAFAVGWVRGLHTSSDTSRGWHKIRGFLVSEQNIGSGLSVFLL